MKRVFDILKQYEEKGHKPDVFGEKKHGCWKYVSSREYVEQSDLVSMGLLAMGLRKGNTVVSITTHNFPEWNFLDMGLGQIGVIHVPVYPYLGKEDLEYILSQSVPSLVFVEDETIMVRVQPVLQKTHPSAGLYSFSPQTDIPHSLQEITRLGMKTREKQEAELQRIREEITEQDVVTLIYTSGTTGNPKGVLLTHRNLVSNILTSSTLHPLGPADRVLSFLPLCHIYERTSNYQFQVCRTTICYAEGFGTIVDNLRELRADGFVAVPRVLEKIQEGFVTKASREKGLSGLIYRRAMALTGEYPPDHRKSLGFRIRRKFYDLLVYRHIRNFLGGRIRFIGVGGASCSLKIERFMWTAGLRACQGYGLTETSPLVSLNRHPPRQHRLGTVGPPIPGVKVRIAPDGEILCQGPNVMKGYLHNEAATRKAIDSGGWFHTGDMGMLTEEGFLIISGRKKEIFKTSYGKYISPQHIEDVFRESPFIDHILVVGEGKKYVAALICLNPGRLKNWLKENHLQVPGSLAGLITHPSVINMMDREVEKQNRQLGETERIKKYVLLSDSWGIKTGEITLSMKLKRDILHEKYRREIESLF